MLKENPNQAKVTENAPKKLQKKKIVKAEVFVSEMQPNSRNSCSVHEVMQKEIWGMVLFAAARTTHAGDLRASGCSKALLDEVAHQPLRPLLILHKQLVGAADLVPFQAVEQSDTHDGRCKEPTPHHTKRWGLTQGSPVLSPREERLTTDTNSAERLDGEPARPRRALPPCATLPPPSVLSRL